MPDAGLTLPPGADPTVIDIAPDAFSERLTLMSTDSIPADVFATIAPADRDRALLRAALRLLAHGAPVTVTELAAAAGVDAGDLEETPIGADIEYDEQGRVLGWGLT